MWATFCRHFYDDATTIKSNWQVRMNIGTTLVAIFRIELESAPIQLQNALIILESSPIQLESSLIHLRRFAIEFESSLIK